jgi:hypothetical protein
MDEITAIVNVFKRPHTLAQQIQAILNQTIPPKCIFIWNNGNPVDLGHFKSNPVIRIFNSSHNFGVWSRFLIGFLAPTKYICIFDDDTIPGNRWFENCVNTMNQKEALLGTIGVLFEADTHYSHLKRYGWDGNREESMPADIVGHSWFFKKDWLSYFTREPPQVHERLTSGEDIHFAYTLQKYANIPVYVPPHPPNDRSLWGSQPETAWGYGTDGNSETVRFTPLSVTYCEYIQRGFRVLVQRHTKTMKDDFDFFCKQILAKTPFALLRPSDGEFRVLQNQTLTNCDNWTFTAGGRLQRDLTEAIQLAQKTNAHIGIPCDCCHLGMCQWYIHQYHLHPNYTTFANVLVNGNWSNWVKLLEDQQVQFTYIGSGTQSTKFAVKKSIILDPLLVNDWDTKADETLRHITEEIGSAKGDLFLFCCGPIAKILIAQLWAKNPQNIYIDAGSSLDTFFKGSTNRFYVDSTHELSKKQCQFTKNSIQL